MHGAATDLEAESPEAGARGLAALRELREWVENSQRTIDDWHKRVDDRIRHMVEGISPFAGVQKDVKVLAERMAALEAKLDGLASEPDASDVLSEPEVLHDMTHTAAGSSLVDLTGNGPRNGTGSRTPKGRGTPKRSERHAQGARHR